MKKDLILHPFGLLSQLYLQEKYILDEFLIKNYKKLGNKDDFEYNTKNLNMII